MAALALFVSFGHNWNLSRATATVLPTVILAMHMFFANWGMLQLATIISTELIPSDLRAVVLSLTNGLAWLLLFALIEVSINNLSINTLNVRLKFKNNYLNVRLKYILGITFVEFNFQDVNKCLSKL